MGSFIEKMPTNWRGWGLGGLGDRQAEVLRITFTTLGQDQSSNKTEEIQREEKT